MVDSSYVITCDKCCRDWDGNAQCPCGISDWDDKETVNSFDDDLFDDLTFKDNDLTFKDNDDLFDDDETFKSFDNIKEFNTPSTRCISPTPKYIQKREFDYKFNSFAKLKYNVTYQKLYKKRYDILYDGWYTKKEMKDYYGNNFIWNQQSPEVLFIKNDLLYLIERCENVPNDKIKLLIDTLFQKIY